MLKPVLELTFWSPIYREEPNLQFSICSKEVDDQICQKHHDGIVVKPQVYLKSGQPESQLFPGKMWVCPKIVSDPKYFKSSAMCFLVAQQFQWIIIILPILPTIKIIILPILPTFNGFSMDYHHHHYIKIAKDQLFRQTKRSMAAGRLPPSLSLCPLWCSVPSLLPQLWLQIEREKTWKNVWLWLEHRGREKNPEKKNPPVE